MLNSNVAELLDSAGLPEQSGIELSGVDACVRGLLRSAFTAKQVGDGLSLSVPRVHHQRRDRALWGIRRASAWRFPASQFVVVDGRPVVQVRGLGRVFRALPADLHPLSVEGFLHTPQPELRVGLLRVSPLDWLRAGRPVAAVLDSAAALDWYV